MPQSPQHRDDSAGKQPSALGRACAHLSTKSRSERALRGHLAEHGHSEGDINDAICALQGDGYVNDQRLAESVGGAAVSRGKGPAWVAAQLQARQVDADAAAPAMATARAAADEVARKTLERKSRSLGSLATPREQARALRLLASRGFDLATAKAALQAYVREHAADAKPVR